VAAFDWLICTGVRNNGLKGQMHPGQEKVRLFLVTPYIR